MDTIFHNLLSSLSIHIITHEKPYTNDSKLGNNCHYFGMLIEGSAHFTCDYCEFDLKEGEIVYIPKGLPYVSFWSPKKQTRFYSIGFNYLEPEKLDAFLLQKLEPSELCRSWIQNMYDEPQANIALISFYRLLQYACDHMTKDLHTNSNPSVYPALQFLRAHCCEEISVPHLANLCRMSESYFYPVFKKETGCTPIQYKNRLKCQQAVELLKNTDHTLEYISDRLHFSTPAFLRKVLKQETGKTPKEIRKERSTL